MKIKIKAKFKKNKFIYGHYLNSLHSNKAFLFVGGGLYGGGNSSLIKNASSYFNKLKYNTFRFSFCDRDDGLEMSDLTFLSYILEIENIVNYLKKKNKEINLVGHSFGAVLAIMFLQKNHNQNIKINLILWEPSLLPWKRKWMEEDYKFNELTGFYHNKKHKELINSELYEDCIKINTVKLITNIKEPLIIISAKNSTDIDSKKYFSKVKNKKSKLSIINNTDHNFSDKKAQKILFIASYEFIK